jgi:hypothetical protein
LTSIINESCYAVFRVLVNPLELGVVKTCW